MLWPIELDLETCPSLHGVTDRHLRSLTVLLNEVHGVHDPTAEAHGPANLVRVRLTVDGYDADDVLDRVCGLVRGCADRVGVGPAILVAAHVRPPRPATVRRMA